LTDISIAVPAILSKRGVDKILEWELDEREEKAFYQGAEKIKEVIGILP